MNKQRHLLIESVVLSAGLLFLLIYDFLVDKPFLSSLLCLLALALVSNLFLSTLLVAWLTLLSIALAVMILLSGVSFMAGMSLFLLVISFPLALTLGNCLVAYYHTIVSKVTTKEKQAEAAYKVLLEETRISGSHLQISLVHWAHNDYFYQVHSKEYRRIIKHMADTLERFVGLEDSVYYLSDGDFLILSTDDSKDYEKLIRQTLLPQLQAELFINKSSHHSLQYQSAVMSMRSSFEADTMSFSKVQHLLKRMLETDLIVEY